MFRILDSTMHPRVQYNAQRFDQQQGYRFTFPLSNTHLVETGVYFHWSGKELRDIAFDISCMSGCSYDCQFCAATAPYRRPQYTLEADEMVQQVASALDYVKAAHGNTVTNCPMFTFSFEGMGEPSVPAASTAIVDTIQTLKKEYQSDTRTAQFIVSTIGAFPQSIREWAEAELALETLQFSLHATTDEERKRLIGRHVGRIEDVLAALRYFKEKRPETLIKVNYLMLQSGDKRNHSQEDLDRLLELLRDSGFKLKLSHLNPTASARKNGLHGRWDETTRKAFEYIRNSYPDAYEYGSSEDLGISCGQLASYAERSAITDPASRGHIADIYEQLIEKNAVLFLGAGASRTAWDARGLARELNDRLPGDWRISDDALTLERVSDSYEARQEFPEVLKTIRSTIQTTEFPPEYIEMTRQPWRAIYTTNYDDFIERAFSKSQQLGLTTRSYEKVGRITQLVDMQHGVDTLPVIKLHGSIDDKDVVISSIQYLEIYQNADRQELLKRLRSDAREHCIVFAGYSLSDFHVAQTLYELTHGAGAPLSMYSVAPGPADRPQDGQRQRDALMCEKFKGAKAVQCTFEELIAELGRLRRQVKVFVSGSLKPVIPGSQTRQDVTEWGQQFLAELGRRFKAEGVIVRSGATATDKAGYHVARAMNDENVRTYIWYGAERGVYENEVDRMIRVFRYGSGPFDVVDRITRECNVAVFVGGSGLSLEEMFSAHVRRLLVIPVKLADQSYASSIIHSFFLNNLPGIEVLESDRSAAAKRRGPLRSSDYLTRDRLGRLDMTHSPVQVAETVMEIIRHFQIAQT
jgi:adenine C2-methylase RlmN of 23S rRNA A2503 and tRNA A37